MKSRRIVSAAIALGVVGLLGPFDAAQGGQVRAAAEITVLCSNALKSVLEDLVPKFEREMKHTVVVKYGLAALLKQRMEGGEAFDVAFVTPAVLDDLVARGKISGDTRTTIARAGLALAIRAGARKPDISTVDTFKRALLNATSIAYAREGASGVAFAALIQRLGIADDLKAKSRLTTTGEEVGQAVANGDAEFGVLPKSEILPITGVEVLGMFPADAQTYIVMVGGVSAVSRQAGAARDLIKYLTAPAALPVIAAKGMENAAATTSKPASLSKKPTVPRMPDGRPDLQGMWDFAQLTPFERPSELASKETLTEEEAEEFAQRRIETTHKDRRDGGAAADVERAYNDFWWDFGTRVSKQASLVVDPPDGRVPARTADAEQRLAQRRNRYDNPEERPLAERCILGFNSGPPMVPSAYNNNVQIVQTRDHVVIVNEMIHSARIVDLNGRPHRPKEIRYLTGDSIGRWEGDTLVVDTTNFSMEGGFRGASTNLHLIERFTLVDGDTFRYEFTVDDRATWTKNWSASIPMVRTDQLMFEYACHEANYALEGVLKGARYQDKQATQTPK